MLTNAFGSRRRRRNAEPIDGQQQVSTRLLNPLNQVYQDLAQTSGGQAIEVTKATLSQATDIIAVSSRSTLVIKEIWLSRLNVPSIVNTLGLASLYRVYFYLTRH